MKQTKTGFREKLARQCYDCPVCNYARRKQKGIVYETVKAVGTKLCPFGNAYEKVYARKPHEPLGD